MLTLPIKKDWFHMINNNYKLEEYRQIKPYYVVRFENLGLLGSNMVPTNKVVPLGFRAGYQSDSPRLIRNCMLTIGSGKEEWGAEKNITYFILHLLKEDELQNYLALQSANQLPTSPNDVLAIIRKSK